MFVVLDVIGEFMTLIRTVFTIALLTASTSFAAPRAAVISSDELVKLVLQRPVVLEGINSKGSLGADDFALRTAKGHVVRANLRANSSIASGIPSGGASSNPEAFHVNMNLSTAAGSTQTLQLRFSGRTKESPAHTRILTYETPVVSPYAGRGKLVAVVGQTMSNDQVWTTKSTYVRFLSK